MSVGTVKVQVIEKLVSSDTNGIADELPILRVGKHYSCRSGVEWSERVQKNVRWETLMGPGVSPRCLPAAGNRERFPGTIHPTPLFLPT
jgi:hypothetical protein